MASATLQRACAIEDCEGPVASRGWCSKHYMRWRTHGDPNVVKVKVRGTCSVADCGRPHDAQGLCALHVARQRIHGDPEYVKPGRPCAQCGEVIARPRPTAKYCSVDCNRAAGEARRRAATWGKVDPDRKCPQCGGGMAGKLPHAVYCSRACKGAALEKRRGSDGRARLRTNFRRTKTRAKIEVKEIARLYNRQQGRCLYCNLKLRKNYHLDHVIPLTRGGAHTIGNIVITCRSCNLSKGSKFITEWRLALSRGGR